MKEVPCSFLKANPWLEIEIVVFFINLAARQGFEPQYDAPEASVLPLNERAISMYKYVQELKLAQKRANGSPGWIRTNDVLAHFSLGN